MKYLKEYGESEFSRFGFKGLGEYFREVGDLLRDLKKTKFRLKIS